MAASMLVLLAEGAKRYSTRALSGPRTQLVTVTAGKSQATGDPPILGGGARKLTYEDAMAMTPATRRYDVAPVVMGGSMIRCGDRSYDVAVAATVSADSRKISSRPPRVPC
jgi:hypothetical protein